MLLVVAHSVLACQPTRPVFELPRHDLGAADASGVATGGAIRFDGHCVWLDGGRGLETNLVWPREFRAIADPLEIHGYSGVAIIREADTVSLGVSDGTRLVPGCPARQAWLVGEVTEVNGVPWPDGTPRTHPRDPPAGVPR